jgi:MFS family permease
MTTPNSNPTERTLSRTIIVIAFLGAVIGGVGAPLITSAAVDLDMPLEMAQWTLTITLFTGAVTAPVLGRLGAGRHRRTTVLIALGLVALGGLLTAVPAHFAVLIIGRGLQGLGLGVTPLLMSIARDHLSAARAESTIATVSVASTVGIGVAYPLMGFVDEAAGLRIAYGLGFLLSLTAFVLAWLALPGSDSRQRVHIDSAGALLLAVGILGVLMVVAQPSVWQQPWIGALILIVSVAAFAGWAAVDRNTTSPLVDLRLFLTGNVLRANIAMLASAVAMYLLFSLFTRYVQTPADSGYGFGLTGAGAGAALIPFSVLGFVAGRATPSLAAMTSARWTFTIHSATVIAGMAVFALSSDSLIFTLIAMSLLGFGVGGVSAIMPRLILDGVPKSETSSVLSINQIVRASGFSFGSALAGLLLATATPADSLVPTEFGYTAAGLVAIPLVALGIAVVAIRRRPASR